MIRFKVRDEAVRMSVKSPSVSFQVEKATVVRVPGSGVDFTTDETLTLDPETKVLSVNKETVTKGLTKTINGIEPDATGNVELKNMMSDVEVSGLMAALQ